MNASDLPDEALFEAALNCRTPAERAAYLDRACAGQPELRQQLEVLLAAHDRSGAFLETPATPIDAALKLDLPGEEAPGTVIGRYKLLEKIGEGGAGAVYMAEQTEPVRRKVALKVIKLGMDTRQVVARFEVERQALALMDHPNIAKVLDAGATETGRPFFVMELVRGTKITDYCDQNHLSTRERLDLFVQVCHAVQHAHQKAIIHRDLKPSNIMVTLHDGVPVPKVIDFGIAKATQQPLTDKTLFTAFQQLIGTPAYMSPEQAELSGLDIDTRSDIYSLGVLLYELLTGKTPFEQKDLLQAGLDEMRRFIREQEPPKPSTRLSTLTKAELTDVAKRRGAETPKLIPLVRGDLDWIVMKCLEKDRRRRYETANNVALDIEHHLRQEPVSAAAPSTLYRAGKFVRRHKVGLAMAAGMVLLLAGGVIVGTWQAVRATRAEQAQSVLRQDAEAGRKEARTEAAKSRQVARFLEEMLEGVGPEVALGRDTTLMREILDKTADRVSKSLTNQPEVAAELQFIIANTYLKLSECDKAEASAREALRLNRLIGGETNQAVAASLNLLARILINRRGADDYAVAEKLARQALEILQAISNEETTEVAMSFYLLASALQNQGRLAEAEEAHLQALAIRRRILKEHIDVASSLNNLAMVYRDQGKLDLARAAVVEALAMQTNLFGAEHPDIASSLRTLALVADSQGNLAEVGSLHRAVLAMRRKLLPAEHLSLVGSVSDVASVLYREGNLAEAEKLAREALAMRRKLHPPDHPELLACLHGLAHILKDQGRFAEAEELCRESLRINRDRGKEDRALVDSLKACAKVLQAKKDFPAALALCQEALKLERKLSAERPAAVVDALFNLANMLGDQGDLAEAKAMVREALDLCLEVLERVPADPVVVNWRYGMALYGQAVLCLATGDTNGYRATATQIVAQLERRVGGNITLVAWACALAPDAVTNYAPLLEAVTNDLAGQTNTTSSLYGLQTLGALLYRAGRDPEAARQLAELHKLGHRVDPNAKTTAATHGAYFLALTHARLGHTNEASAWFQDASSFDPSAGGARAPAAAKVYWWNRLTLQLLRKEADSVVNARAPQPASPP
jgi:tetratricopeptide (TPR) repeat protein